MDFSINLYKICVKSFLVLLKLSITKFSSFLLYLTYIIKKRGNFNERNYMEARYIW